MKSLNYLNNILAKIEGIQAGCIEALMLNHKGEVSECTGDNIFVVKNGEIATPPGVSVVYVVVGDADAAYERAKAAGAEVTEPVDQDYGSRDLTVTDPDGNRWSLGTYGGTSSAA